MAQKANILPIQVALGDDELKREQVIKRLRLRLEEEGDLSFDFNEFDGETANGDDIVAACLTIPFLADRRLVVVRHAEKLRKADNDALTAYAQDPADFCVLALSTTKLAKSTRLYKSIAALGKIAIIDCALPKGRDLQQKVVLMAKTHGLQLSDSGASYLIECIGSDTVFLDNELGKLALACQGKGTVTEREVAQYVEATVEVKPWKFLEPFSARQLQASLRWLDEARGVSSYSLVPQCATRLRELICAKTLDMQGRGGQLAAELGLSAAESWKIKNHLRYARAFSLGELTHALSALRDCEKKMKSSDNPDETFRLWVLQTLAKR